MGDFNPVTTTPVAINPLISGEPKKRGGLDFDTRRRRRGRHLRRLRTSWRAHRGDAPENRCRRQVKN